METKNLLISFAILYVVTGVAIGIFSFLNLILQYFFQMTFFNSCVKVSVSITPDTMPIILPLQNVTFSRYYKTKFLLTVSVPTSSNN